MSRLRRLALACAAALPLVLPRAGQAEEIVVTLWGQGMTGVPYAVAMEKGFFKEAGIDITSIVGGNGGGEVVRNVMASALPYGEVATPALLAGRAQGLPIVAVNAGNFASDNVWVTMPDSPVKTIKDLIGRKAAYTTPKSISEAFLLMALKGAGVDPASLTVVAAGAIGSGLTLLESGAVHTALIIQPIHSMRAGRYRTLFTVKEALPPVQSNVGITTPDFAAAHPDKIRAIIAGRYKGVQYVYAHPEESGLIMARAYDMDPKIAVAAVTAMAKAGYWSAGELDAKLLDNMAEALRLTGEVQGAVDWPKAIDLDYLPADLKAKSRLALQ